MSRLDAAVAACFVLAAVAESIAVHRDTPVLLAFDVAGALCLVSMAVRRRHPLVPICVVGVVGVVGTTLTEVFWPDASDNGGVWILAMLLASYTVGAHVAGPAVVLGVLVPLAVVSGADLTTRSGWDRISGMVFVTVFIGLLPTSIGRLVRVRRMRLEALHEQHDRIMRAQRAQQESAVLGERLRATERLRPTLVDGLRRLADQARTGTDPGDVEDAARALLGRTREEVVALTAPLEPPCPDEPPVADHLAALRVAAQRWTVLVAGAVVVGLWLETTQVLSLTAPGWVVLPAAVAVGAPLSLAWWRPSLAVGLTWVAAAAYAHLVAPLDGSLSETGLAMTLAFTVALLSARRAAVAGLGLCWLGQLVGVGTPDVAGEALLLLGCWLGGLAISEVSRLTEQARANNDLLARTEESSAAHAVLEERLRLAREIHDAIGHSLTVVALQAGAARRLTDGDPQRAREVMRTVATVAADGAAALDRNSPADIAGVVEGVRATGLPVEADLVGMAELDPAQCRVACRVVQEALTNVLRHAPGSCACVVVRRSGAAVEVVVANTASSGRHSDAGTGRGLTGLRERATAAGGRVTWAALPDGGFEVRAVLPAHRLADVSS